MISLLCGIQKQKTKNKTKQTKKLIGTENRLMVEGQHWERRSQKVQTATYRINKSWDPIYSIVTNTAYLKLANKRVYLTSSHHKKKIIFCNYVR